MGVIFIICGAGKGREVFHFYKIGWLFPYFLFGSICRKHPLPDRFGRVLTSSRFIVLNAVAYGMILFGFYRGTAYTEFYGGYYLVPEHTGYYVVYYMEGVVGIAIIFMTAAALKHLGKFAAWVGTYSLDIYVLHIFMVRILLKLFDLLHMHAVLPDCIMVVAFSLLIVASVSLLSERILHKFIMYRISVGGR